MDPGAPDFCAQRLDQKEEHMTAVSSDLTPHESVQNDLPPAPTRLLVVDDHAAVRAGLRQLLEDQADFAVVAAVASAEDALSVAEREPIDVAIVDYQLRGRNGLWLSRKLKRLPQPPAVLIYSAYTEGVLASAAVMAEADGIVNKGSRGSDLCAAIRSVADGSHRLPPVPSWLGEVLRQRLDHEEQAIFGLLLAGIKPTEIARTLELSDAALESRLWGMLRKVQAPSERTRETHRPQPARNPPSVAPRWARSPRLSSSGEASAQGDSITACCRGSAAASSLRDLTPSLV
jgi:DNA-binding NarL/FixJ family response regulator